MMTHQVSVGTSWGNAVRLRRRTVLRAGAGAVAAITAGGAHHRMARIALAQATPTPSDAAIPPVVWELVEYTERGGEPVAIDDPTRYTLQFLAEGELLARVDCNQGHGGYTAADGVLTVTPMATTRMACPPGSVDTVFLRLLLAATAFGFDADGRLRLRGDMGELHLRPAAAGS